MQRLAVSFPYPETQLEQSGPAYPTAHDPFGARQTSDSQAYKLKLPVFARHRPFFNLRDVVPSQMAPVGQRKHSEVRFLANKPADASVDVLLEFVVEELLDVVELAVEVVSVEVLAPHHFGVRGSLTASSNPGEEKFIT